VVEYGFNKVLVVVEVSLSGALVSVDGAVDGSGAGASVDVDSVVVVVVVAVLVVVVVLGRVVVLVVVVVGTSDPGGAVEWRDVCTTANTIRATTTSPPTAAANTTPGCSYHRPSATGIDRRASRQPRHN
jgi:hypothetical protein